jgi:hypothetical protein
MLFFGSPALCRENPEPERGGKRRKIKFQPF